ncbi:MAG: hypothetical protein K8I27_05030 [Planctomycetes bacterium]|nr:hypothetical protein [Planctomycetota bacterium]
METLLYILQTTKGSSGAGSAIKPEIVAGVVVVICIAMLAAGVRVVLHWPHEKKGKLAVGGVMTTLPLFTALFAVTVYYLAERVGESVDFWAFLLVPASWVIWLGFAIYSAVLLRVDDAEYMKHRDARRAAFEAGSDPVQPYSAAVPDDVIDAEDPPAAEFSPRRAVSIPAADSDSGRASEQTLKRMTLEKLEESNSGAPKPPRAGEIPENPILPDEVVKIRCLACDKKMKAEGPKFARQRRCPACKAEPFRYVTAV